MKRITLVLLLLFPLISFSQIETPIDDDFNKMMDVLEDAETEMEGMFTLRFADAETDDPVDNATIEIQNVGTFTSDTRGMVKFPIQEDGVYAFKFKKDGYITSDFTFEVIAETIFFNRFSVSKLLDLGQIRIVLDWSSSPDDLDLHLEKMGEYHISYHHKRVADDRSANLDRDDIDGKGPETITINDVDENAVYNCYIHDYSNRENPNSAKLSKSKARLTVYHNNMVENIYYVPTNKERGTRWDVFQLKQGQFVNLNRLAN